MSFGATKSSDKYENLLTECEVAIEAEFKDLNEHMMGEWGRVYSLDGDFCKKATETGDFLIPFRGFNCPKLTDKCLPYDCEHSCKSMIEVCNMLMTDPVVQGATSKMVNHVIGARGHEYTVTLRPGKTPSERSDGRRKEIELGISLGKERIKAGTKKGWARVQRESFRRRLRGEFFRRIEVVDDRVEVRFTEPIDIQHPGRWDDVINPPEGIDLEAKDETGQRIGDLKPSGAYGIHYAEDDVYDVKGYFEDQGPSGDEPRYFFHSVEEMQQGKMLGDSNDERGVGLFYYSYIYIRMAGKIMDSLFRISQIQAKYAAIWTFAETARVGKIRAIADQVAKDNANDNDTPVETAPGEHMGKGWELELPGTKIRTREWTAMISQLLHFAGASADMPDFMMSNSAEGGRSNLIAAEGPFDLTCQTHQDDQNEHDIPLLWTCIAAVHNWDEKELEKYQLEFVIDYKAPSVATRDFHRYSAALIALIHARVMSPNEASDRVGANKQQLKEWEETLPKDAKTDPELLAKTTDTTTGAGKGSGSPSPGSE